MLVRADHTFVFWGGGGEINNMLDSPIDVTGVEDLSKVAGNLGLAAHKLDGDGGPAQVGGHGEVGDGGHEGDTGGDVMKESMGARTHEAHGIEDQGRHRHDGGDGPVPVGPTRGDGDVGRHPLGGVTVHPKRVVSHDR